MSPSVTVYNQVTGRYLLPILNNTGITFNAKNKTMIAFIERLHRTDFVDPCTHSNAYACTSNYKNRKLFHTRNSVNHNIASINNKDKLYCSDKKYNIGSEIDSVKRSTLISMLNNHSNLFAVDIINLKQTNTLQATFNTGHSQPIKQRPYKKSTCFTSQHR